MPNLPLRKNLLTLFSIFLAYCFLTFAYLAPGSAYLIEKRTDIALSDGTDQVAAPFSYNLLLQRITSHPVEFFYGATYSDKVNPPQGAVLWFSWFEKFCVVVFSFFLPVEQFGAGIAFLSITISAFCMFYLGNYLKWPRWIGFGLGLSWGYSAFTLARSKVHPALDAIYFVPLLFLVFTIIREKRNAVSIFTASLILLLIAIVPHYYLISTCFLLPFWIYYVLEGQDYKLAILKKSLIIIAPSFILLLWSLLMPIGPLKENSTIEIYPRTGKVETGLHPFLFQFAADPLDYLSGNIGLSENDINPIKNEINKKIYNNIASKRSNTHEHAVGIRWLIILLSLAPLVLIVKNKAFFSREEKKYFYFFYSLATFAFLLSLSPLMFGQNIGPSMWVYKLVSQIRVPSRSGIFVHFSLLMIVGLFLTRLLKHFQAPTWKYKFICILFPTLIFLEFPPISAPPTAEISPVNKELNFANCGLGMHFPYINAGYNILSYYNFLQVMRNSDCKILNSISWSEPRDIILLNNFAKYPIAMEAIKKNDREFERRFITFAQCMPLDWVVFDKDVPFSWRQNICGKLGWEMRNEVTCIDTNPDSKGVKPPEACLN